MRHSKPGVPAEETRSTKRVQSRSGCPYHRAGFTLIELLIVVGVIVALIALLLPAIHRVRESARSTECQSHLAELGVARMRYGSARRQSLRASQWDQRLSEYLDGEERLTHCPSRVEIGNSYGMNHRAHRMAGGDGNKIVMLDYDQPITTLVVPRPSDQDDWPQAHAPRHRGRVNILLHSGTVETRDPETIDPRKCRPFLEVWRPTRDFAIRLIECRSEGPFPPAGSPDSGEGPAGSTVADLPGKPACPAGTPLAYLELLYVYASEPVTIPFAPGALTQVITDPAKFTAGNACPQRQGDYEIWFESGYTYDWNDLRLRFKRLDNGRVRMTVVQDDVGAHSAKIYGPDGTLLMTLTLDADDTCRQATYVKCP